MRARATAKLKKNKTKRTEFARVEMFIRSGALGGGGSGGVFKSIPSSLNNI